MHSIGTATSAGWLKHELRLARSRRLIHPAERSKTVWEVFLAVLVLYSVTVVPVRIGFAWEEQCESGLFWFEVVVDLLFLLDVAVNFRCTFHDAADQLELDARRVALRYLRFWFWVDFASSIPLDLIMYISLPGYCAAAGAQAGGELKLLKVFRLVRLLKLLRLLKINKLVSVAQQEYGVNPSLVELLGLMIRILAVTHWVGCLWNMPAAYYYSDGNLTAEEQLGRARETWLSPLLLAYDEVEPLTELPPVSDIYVASMYWTVTTISTIGYGDQHAVRGFERVLSIVIMLLGCAFFGFVVGGMQDIANQFDANAARTRVKLDLVKAAMHERGMPQPMARRVKEYYSHYLSECADAEAEKAILDELCPPLRTEVLIFLNARLIESIAFFRGQETAFIASICRMLRPSFAAPHDVIFREGELALEMFFVQAGRVEVLIPFEAATGEDEGLFVDGRMHIVVDEHAAGAHFGETALLLENARKKHQVRKALLQQSQRETSARAASYCSMFSLSKTDLFEVLDAHPEVQEAMVRANCERVRRWKSRQESMRASRDPGEGGSPLGGRKGGDFVDDSPRGSSAGSDLISLGASLAALQELEAGYYLRLGEPSPRQPVSRLVRRIGRLRIGRIRRSFISYAKERRTEYLRGESVR